MAGDDLQLDMKVALLQHLIHLLDILVLQRDSAYREDAIADVQGSAAVGDPGFLDA